MWSWWCIVACTSSKNNRVDIPYCARPPRNTEKCFISLKKEILNWETGQFKNAQLHRAREWFVYLCSGVQRLSSISITKGAITPDFFFFKKLENVLVQTSACKRATRSQAHIPAQEKIGVFSLHLKILTQNHQCQHKNQRRSSSEYDLWLWWNCKNY